MALFAKAHWSNTQEATINESSWIQKANRTSPKGYNYFMPFLSSYHFLSVVSET